jgi:integrase
MSLYKRGEFWWYDFTVNGERHRGATKLRSKAAARKAEDGARERAALGASARPVPTIGDASARWFIARVAGKKSEKTTAQRLEIMLRLIGHQTLVRDIDTPDIEDAIQRRRLEPTRQKRLPTNSTVNRDLIDTTLRPILRYCDKTLKVEVRRIEWADLKLAEPKGRSRSFTPAELSAWRDALPEWHRPVFDFMARYGVRLREAFFPLDAFDGARVTIRRRKNGLPLTVPLLEEDAREMAARAGRARAAKLDTVWFREMKDGKLRPVHWRGFQSASKAALEAACVADARPAHDLRHHAATGLLRATGNLKTVQRLLGHESIASTARYAHADEGDVLAGLRHAIGTSETDDEKSAIENNRLKASGNGT